MNTLTTPVVGGLTPPPTPAPLAPPAPRVPAPAAASEPAPTAAPALLAHAVELRDASGEVAQQLLGQVAESLFGKGTSVTFAAVQAEASASLGQASATGSAGSAAAIGYREAAHFVGKGQIVTADGARYDFEIELQYEARVDAGASSAKAAPEAPPVDGLALTGHALPEIQVPGGLEDLFKLLGRQLNAQVHGQDGSDLGQFNLRLLRLVNSAALLAPKAQPQESPAKVASTYAETAAAS